LKLLAKKSERILAGSTLGKHPVGHVPVLQVALALPISSWLFEIHHYCCPVILTGSAGFADQ